MFPPRAGSAERRRPWGATILYSRGVSEHHHHGHGHGESGNHVAADRDWDAFGDRLELEGDVTLPLLAPMLAAIADAVGPEDDVRRVIDIGSGPGAAAVALAQRFPLALVTAVDASAPLLERVPARAARFGVAKRVTTAVADLEQSLDHVAPPASVDVAWASMVLHHVADVPRALAAVHALLRPGAVFAIIELRRLYGTLPEGFDVGRAGFGERLATIVHAALAEHLPPGAMTLDWPALLTDAGFDVRDNRELVIRLPSPLDPLAQRLALEELRGSAHRAGDRLDAADRELLTALADPDDPRCVIHRADFTYDLSRTALLARRH